MLRALHARLPNEPTVYLGDTARVPYGSKSKEVVTRYSLKNAEMLQTRGIKMLVVACNTASATALDALRAALPIPVVGVIEPGAAAAARATRSANVAVIGTQATISSGAYQRALVAQRADVRVRARACPMFVPLAEEGWTEGDVPRLVAESYLRGFCDGDVDTLVLGCTHYPLLHDVIANAVGPQVTLIDSAAATAQATADLLATLGLQSTGGGSPTREYLVTDTPERFQQVGQQFLGVPLSGARQVDLKFG